MKLSMSEILQKASAMSSRKEKVNFLRMNYSLQFHKVLEYALNPDIKFKLPEGIPPFTPLQTHEAQGMLYSEARRLYLFVEGGHPGLDAQGKQGDLKRERLFIGILESIDPDDAKLLCAVKDKKIPYKGITYKLVKEAFGEYRNG